MLHLTDYESLTLNCINHCIKKKSRLHILGCGKSLVAYKVSCSADLQNRVTEFHTYSQQTSCTHLLLATVTQSNINKVQFEKAKKLEMS